MSHATIRFQSNAHASVSKKVSRHALRFSVKQRRLDPAERPAAREHIRNSGIPETAVTQWISNNDCGARGLFHRFRRALQQRFSLRPQKRFIASHPGTAPAGKHEASTPSGAHAEMITLGVTACQAQLSNRRLNIMIHKCFILGFSMAALVPFAHGDSRVFNSVVQSDARTGRLVRHTKVSQSPSADRTNESGSERENTPQKLIDMIDAIALENNVEAPLVHSVIQTESNYNPFAVSNKGAQGLMQLIPATAKRFGVRDSFDVQENVEGGTKYLKYLVALFHGDYSRAIAAYNAGEAAVTKYDGIPPFKETQNYVQSVSHHLESRRRAAHSKPPAANPVIPADAPAVDAANPVIASVLPDGRVLYRTP